MGKKKEREAVSGYDPSATMGDMMTNLLTFFVLLYSFTMTATDSAQWESFVIAFTGSPPSTAISLELSPTNVGAESFVENTTGSSNMTNEGDNSSGGLITSQAEINQEFDQLYEQIQGYIQENDLGNTIVAEKIEDLIIVRVLDGVIFESGSADIKSEDNAVLDSIGGMFFSSKSIINQVQVEGHTDNVPIHNANFEDNWDLSTKRATNVVRYIHDKHGIEWEKFSAAGYGEYRPIAENETAGGRQQNRRVNFIIERAVITDLQQ